MSFNNNLAYEASAGSGKTFMLVVRYLGLLFVGANPSKILALTFTNKAANEMQEKIITTLENLENKKELDVISEKFGISKEEILKNKSKVLDNFLNTQTKIMTIDSFFTKILRKFSLYVSLMPDFQTLSTQNEKKLLEQFLKEVDVTNNKHTLINLSLESKKKIYDLFFLLDDFYVKSKELSSFKFTYYHNIEAIKQEALDIVKKMDNIIKLCDKASTTAKKGFEVEKFEDILSKSWLGRESLNYRTFSKCYVAKLDELLEELYDVLKDYYSIKEQNFFYALLNLSIIYQKAKKEIYKSENEVGFNDVTLLTYEILKERIDKEFLYFRLDSSIEHILLDEFQDTSILQYEILHPLIQEALSGKGINEEGSFFFVGDKKQSIYRFRGGISSLFDEVAKINSTKIEPLVYNYRSKSKIVDFVNDTFKNIIDGYIIQKTIEENNGGYVEIIENEDILESLKEKLLELIEFGLEKKEMAILCSTNKDGESIKNYLKQYNIEVATETSTKLIYQKSVKTLLEYLKYIYFKEEIFRYNFLSLLGRDIDIEFVDFNKKELIVIIKEAIEKYEIFNGDLNLFKFIEVCASYSSIEELLFNYERIEAEAYSESFEGIKVLTVHKSKGLEYKYVFVIDRLTKTPPHRESILYDYDGINLKNVYLRQKGRDKIDKNYLEALKRDLALNKEDNINVLYVAFTRAKESLFVIKKEKNSIFDDVGLKPFKSGELIANKKEQNLQIKEKSLHVKKYNEFYYGSQGDLLATDKKYTKQEDIKAQNFGLALHYMLEMLEDFNVESIDEAKQSVINRYGFLLDEKELNDIVNRVKSLVEFKEFKNLLSKKYYKEQPMKYKKNLYYIDLLIEKEDEYIVIDYKSGTNYQDEHIKQIKRYINALTKITCKKTTGYLCYILEDKINLQKI